MKTQDVNKLRQIIEKECNSVEQEVLYKDAFAMGCYLHRSGEYKAGRKLCYGVLAALGFDRRKTYFSQILESVAGNETEYARTISAHLEINKLFDRASLAQQ